MSANLLAARSALKLGFLVSSLTAAALGARLATEGAAGFAPHDHPLRPLAAVPPLKPAEPLPPPARETQVAIDIPILPAKPFVFHGGAADRTAALTCMTQAVYYEAGFEPLGGAQAVAQVVLNRMRHPIFPKSICGVVYQGAELKTGCQFSFTCDGSLGKAPAPAAWARARTVAEKAMNGFVQTSVGEATHYHTQWVRPWWAPTVTKITQVGAQIFYRWPGQLGLPSAFNGRYAGHEHVGEGALIAPGVRSVASAAADGRVHMILAANSPSSANAGPVIETKADAMASMALATSKTDASSVRP